MRRGVRISSEGRSHCYTKELSLSSNHFPDARHLHDRLHAAGRNSVELFPDTLPQGLMVRLGFFAIHPRRNIIPAKQVSKIAQGKVREANSLLHFARTEQTAMAGLARDGAMQQRAAPLLSGTPDSRTQLRKLLLKSWRSVSAELCLADARIDKVENDTRLRNRDLRGEILGGHNLNSLGQGISAGIFG